MVGAGWLLFPFPIRLSCKWLLSEDSPQELQGCVHGRAELGALVAELWVKTTEAPHEG